MDYQCLSSTDHESQWLCGSPNFSCSAKHHFLLVLCCIPVANKLNLDGRGRHLILCDTRLAFCHKGTRTTSFWKTAQVPVFVVLLHSFKHQSVNSGLNEVVRAERCSSGFWFWFRSVRWSDLKFVDIIRKQWKEKDQTVSQRLWQSDLLWLPLECVWFQLTFWDNTAGQS